MPRPVVRSPVPTDLLAAFRTVLRDPDLDLRPETLLEDLTGWDSMAHIAVMVEAECRFGCRFDVPDIEAVTTVGDIVRLIADRTGVETG